MERQEEVLFWGPIKGKFCSGTYRTHNFNGSSAPELESLETFAPLQR